MRWYQILLMLSVIDFAIAAPVVVQGHEVRVSVVDAAKDGTATSPLRRYPSEKWLANVADRTNAPSIPRSSDSGHWREQEPRQHNLRPRTGSNDSPESSNPVPPIDYANNPLSPSPPPRPGSSSPSPMNRALTDEPDPSNPPSPHDGSHASNLASPSTSTHDTPPPDGSPQIASSPDRSPSFSSWQPANSHSSSTSSWSSGSSWESWDSGKNKLISPDQLSTGESHPPSPGQIDHPPPALPSEPGPSTRVRPSGAKSSYDESMQNAAKILMAMSRKGFPGFRPRTYGSGAVDTAKGRVAGNH